MQEAMGGQTLDFGAEGQDPLKEDGPQIDMAKLNVNQALFKEFEKLMKGSDIDRDMDAYAKSLDDIEKALKDGKEGMDSIKEY